MGHLKKPEDTLLRFGKEFLLSAYRLCGLLAIGFITLGKLVFDGLYTLVEKRNIPADDKQQKYAKYAEFRENRYRDNRRG